MVHHLAIQNELHLGPFHSRTITSFTVLQLEPKQTMVSAMYLGTLAIEPKNPPTYQKPCPNHRLPKPKSSKTPWSRKNFGIPIRLTYAQFASSIPHTQHTHNPHSPDHTTLAPASTKKETLHIILHIFCKASTFQTKTYLTDTPTPVAQKACTTRSSCNDLPPPQLT